MNQRNKRITSYFILFSLFLVLGIVYAILQANLQINGTAKITQNTWDIHFENIVVNQDSVSIGTGDTAATIDPTNNCKVDFSVTLSLPGDYYEFTVDAKNSGTIDAMIGTLTKTLKVNNVETETVPEYLNYTVTYEDGGEILENQLLAKGTKETYKIRVEFKTDIDAENLPDATTLSMSVEPVYLQADSGAINVIHLPLISLTEGLIPVTIANDGTVTAVSKNDDNWYDYDNKIWANAVLTTETNRSTYQAIANGTGSSTTIPSDEILAYYVWIPRYSYKIWTLDASSDHTGDEQTIDIKFVDTNTKEIATSVGDWYTHPAFTFGEEELPGFWVGKFESSTDTSSTCYTSPSESNCNNTNQSPRIVPNADSLRLQDIGNQFATSLKFAGGTQSGSNVTFAGSSTYGLTSTTDSHMMKNSEWGAVAYLSHSAYGINSEIRKNNYRKDTTTYATLTGCGANAANANTTTIVTTCAIPYGTTSGETNNYPQSTTGNISGIFDMSGGAYEYVMGNYNNKTNMTLFPTLPSSKYYDVYLASQFTGDYSTNMTFCTLATCGGHALNETRAWHSDYADFVNSSVPWFIRGGYYDNSQYAGAFSSGSISGSARDYASWRGVLVAR